MKGILVIFSLILTLTFAHEIDFKEGIEPKKLTLEELSESIAENIAWKELQEAVVENGELDNDGFIQADVTIFARLILRNLNVLMVRLGFDPLGLPDQNVPLNPVGSVSLTNGYVENLSTLNISDRVIAKYSISTKVLELTLPLSFESLVIYYDYDTRVLLLSVSGEMDAKVKHVRLNLRFGFNFTSLHAFVDKVDIKNTGSISVNITGLGPLDYIADLIADTLTTVFHGLIIGIIDLVIQRPVQNVVESINDFIDTILNRNSTALFMY